jgi:hypothetical protein
MIDLTIRLREDADADEYVFRLVADGGQVSPESTLPDPEAALAAVQQYGEQIFFPEPGPPRLCTQQYGGPQVAAVSGTFRGRRVDSLFSRTDGCEISRWNAMAPLLGSAGGAWGNT